MTYLRQTYHGFQFFYLTLLMASGKYFLLLFIGLFSSPRSEFANSQQFCPPEDTWPCLGTLLVVTRVEGKELLLASRVSLLPDILQRTGQLPHNTIHPTETLPQPDGETLLSVRAQQVWPPGQIHPRLFWGMNLYWDTATPVPFWIACDCFHTIRTG